MCRPPTAASSWMPGCASPNSRSSSVGCAGTAPGRGGNNVFGCDICRTFARGTVRLKLLNPPSRWKTWRRSRRQNSATASVILRSPREVLRIPSQCCDCNGEFRHDGIPRNRSNGLAAGDDAHVREHARWLWVACRLTRRAKIALRMIEFTELGLTAPDGSIIGVIEEACHQT